MEAQSPIPNPLPNDDEDVSWALSTAGALWARGEHVEALKWLRRAAEQASDVNDDLRALALFKAAAEVTQASTSTPPPPSTSLAVPPVASAAASAMSPSSSPPSAPQPSAPPPPPRKAPPSLPPRTVAPPPVPSSRTAAPPPAAPPARTAPPPAPARQVPSSGPPSPVTKQSRTPAPAPASQISPAARSMPASALAAAAAPVRRPAATSPARAAAAPRAGAPGTTVPTRPVAYRPPPATTPPAGAVTERPPPPSRRGRAVDEVLAHQNQNASGGPDLDDLDENTQVLQAVRSAPSPRQDRAQELELSWHSVLAEPPAAESADELTDPGLHARAIEALPPEDQTGPISAPERTAVTTWTEAERAAFMAAPDTLGPEPTSRRVAPLLAHRVAVIASSTPGEIRLVLLDASGAPPKGAAIALLVPLSATDGDVVTQLFGSLE